MLGMERVATRPLTLVALSLFTLAYAFGTARQLRLRTNQPDFSVYYVSAWELRHRVDPYTTDFRDRAQALDLNVGDIDRQAETPAFLLCFEVLTLLRPVVAYWTWTSFNLLALVASLILLLSCSSSLSAGRRLLLAFAALWYVPLADTFHYAQSELIILLLFALTMHFLRRSQESLAGLSIAAAILLRAFPLVLLGYVFFEKRWSVLTFAAVGVIAGLSLTIAIVGLKICLSFLAAIGLSKSRTLFGYPLLSGPGNLALASAVSRIFWRTWRIPLTPALDLYRRLSTAFAVITVLALSTIVSLRRFNPDYTCRRFGLWVATMLMVCPVLWLHYVTIMLVPLILIASHSIKTRKSSPGAWLALLSYSLILLSRGPLIALYGSLPLFYLNLLAEAGFISVLLAYAAAWCFAREPLAVKLESRRVRP